MEITNIAPTLNAHLQEIKSNVIDFLRDVEDPRTLFALMSLPVVGQIVHYLKEKEVWKQIDTCSTDLEKIALRMKLNQLKQRFLISNCIQVLFLTAINLLLTPVSVPVTLIALSAYALMNGYIGLQIAQNSEEILSLNKKWMIEEIANRSTNDVRRFLEVF